MAWTHRPALDGLRAIAVYLVLLFHAQVGLFDGGFLGVDLFFVLSGFLVSSILLEELYDTGHLRLGRFYARRVRRLLPAALVVVVATSAIAVLLASTVRRIPWVGDAQASLLYVANWRFLFQANDYFGAGIDRSPFLHFWSLSIEEQFYFVFPLTLVLLFRLRTWWRPALLAGVLGLFLASVAAQLYWASRDVNHAYYGTDARLYQLFAGVLAALVWRHLQAHREAEGDRSVLLTRVLTVKGIGGVLLAGLAVMSSSLVPYSASTRGLLGTVLSFGLILAIMENRGRALDRLLTRPVVTYLGRISYGTYLWHWPVIILLAATLKLDAWTTAGLTAALATGLAALSFEVLEHPIRRSSALGRYGYSTLVVGLAASVVLASTAVPALLGINRPPAVITASVGAASSGTAKNLEGPVPTGLDWKSLTSDQGHANSYCTFEDTTSCVAHQGASGLTVMLAGDSQSLVLAPAMVEIAEKQDFTLLLSIVGRCPWQMDVYHGKASRREVADCRAAREPLYDGLLEELGVDVMVLTQLPRIDALRDQRGSGLLGPALSARAVTDTVNRIEQAGAAAVMVLTALTPKDSIGQPLDCLASATALAKCRVPAPAEPSLADSLYRTAATTSAAAATIDLNQVLCPAWPVCDPLLDGLPVWRDGLHFQPRTLVARDEHIWQLLRSTGFFDVEPDLDHVGDQPPHSGPVTSTVTYGGEPG